MSVYEYEDSSEMTDVQCTSPPPGLVAACPLREAGGGSEHLGCGVFVSLSVSAPPGPRRQKGFAQGR